LAMVEHFCANDGPVVPTYNDERPAVDLAGVAASKKRAEMI